LASQELSFSHREPKADGWFGVTKLQKETLIGASNSGVAKSKEASNTARSPTNKSVSYANVVQGATGGEHYGQLKGWRCRACGSWDIYVAILGDVGVTLAIRDKEHEQGMPSKTSGKDVRCQNLSVSPRKDDSLRILLVLRLHEKEGWYIVC